MIDNSSSFKWIAENKRFGECTLTAAVSYFCTLSSVVRERARSTVAMHLAKKLDLWSWRYTNCFHCLPLPPSLPSSFLSSLSLALSCVIVVHVCLVRFKDIAFLTFSIKWSVSILCLELLGLVYFRCKHILAWLTARWARDSVHLWSSFVGVCEWVHQDLFFLVYEYCQDNYELQLVNISFDLSLKDSLSDQDSDHDRYRDGIWAISYWFSTFGMVPMVTVKVLMVIVMVVPVK